MNRDALGAVAELAGAFGVIASLLYLGFHIRGQNVESRLTAGNHMTSPWNKILADLANNGEPAELFIRAGADFASLNAVETVRYSSHMGRTFRSIEFMYTQHTEGKLDDAVWHCLQRSAEDICKLPRVKSWWQTPRQLFGTALQDLVQPMIDDTAPQRLCRKI